MDTNWLITDACLYGGVQSVMGVLVLLSLDPSATPSATVADVKSSASPPTPAVASTSTSSKGTCLYLSGGIY